MRVRLVNYLSASLLVAGAAAWAAAPDMLGLPTTVALALAVGAAVILQVFRATRTRLVRQRNLLTTATSVYRLSRDFEPVSALRLRRSERAERAARAVDDDAGGDSVLPPYVPGRIDGKLERALASGSFVLVVGNSLCGKSRAAYEAVRRVFGKAEIWVPSGPDGLAALLAADPPLSVGWRTVVVWLDDLGYFLEAASGGERKGSVNDALLARHLTGPPWWSRWRRPRLVFVATMSRREFDGITDLSGADSQSARSRAADVIGLASRVELADGAEAGWDMSEARRLYPGIDFGRGIGRAFAEAEALMRAYRHGADRLGRAIVRAAVDWKRIGAGWPGRAALRQLVAVELPGAVIDEEQFGRGLLWANREIASGQRLLSERPGEGRSVYHAHAYLLDVDEGYGEDASPRPVPEAVWDIALRSLDAGQLLEVADRAKEYATYVAERVLLFLADSGQVRGITPLRTMIAHLQLALLYAQVPGGEDRAEARMTAVLAGPDPDLRSFAYLARAALRDDQPGRKTEAEADFAAAIAVEGAEPDTVATAHCARGMARSEAGDEEGAEDDFTAGLGMEGANPSTRADCHGQRALLRQQQGRARDSIADYTAAIRLDPDPASAAIAYTLRSDVQDEPEKELADLNAAVRRASPEWLGRILCVRGEALARAGQWERAEVDYDAALAMDGVDADELGTWTVDRAVALGRRDVARAEADCTAVIEGEGVEATTRCRAHYTRAYLKCDEVDRRPTKALVAAMAEDLDRAIEGAAPDVRAESHYLRGNLWKHGHGSIESAIADYTTAIETPGADGHTIGSSYIHRGLAHESEHRYREAEEDMSAGIRTPDISSRSLAVGYVDRALLRWRTLKEPRGAEQDFRAALAVSGGEDMGPKALRHLADLLRSQGRLAEENDLYLKAVHSQERPELAALALSRLEKDGRKAPRNTRRQRRRLQRRSTLP